MPSYYERNKYFIDFCRWLIEHKFESSGITKDAQMSVLNFFENPWELIDKFEDEYRQYLIEQMEK